MSEMERKPLPKRNNVRRGVLIGVVASAFVLVGFLGSYAFFINNGGTKENEELSVTSGSLSLIFSDGNPTIDETLEFGGSVTKTFNLRNLGSLDATAKIIFDDLINTYTKGSLTYSLTYSETEDGTYSPVVNNKNVPTSNKASDKTLLNGIEIPAGKTYYYKLTINLNYLSDVDQTSDLNAIFSTHFSIGEAAEKGLVPLLSEAVANKTDIPDDPYIKTGNPNFAEPAMTDEGIYAMEDDYGTSYYFRGSVENNYVKFGTWKEGANAGKPMYWRIIRINGDGSLRIQYDGTSAHANGESNADRIALTNQVYNTTRNDAKYIGYMYGPAGTTASTSKEQAQTNVEDSEIKKAIEAWYKTNLSDMDSNISDNIFCNDRSIPGKATSGWGNDTGLGYGGNATAYGATARTNVWNSATVETQPKFTCENKNDAFTKSDTVKGNGKLTQKVGMITADEVVAAGSGKYNITNTSYYLNKGNWYWSLSPYNFYGSGVRVFIVNADGSLYYAYVNISAGGVAPVISLSAKYVKTMKGDGTASNPFRDSSEA